MREASPGHSCCCSGNGGVGYCGGVSGLVADPAADDPLCCAIAGAAAAATMPAEIPVTSSRRVTLVFLASIGAVLRIVHGKCEPGSAQHFNAQAVPKAQLNGTRRLRLTDVNQLAACLRIN